MLIIFNLRRYKKSVKEKSLLPIFLFIMTILFRCYEIEVETLSANLANGVILHFD